MDRMRVDYSKEMKNLVEFNCILIITVSNGVPDRARWIEDLAIKKLIVSNVHCLIRERPSGNSRRRSNELAKMKAPKKLCQRDPICVLKKSHTARCGFLCCTLMICVALTVFHEGNLVDFFVDNRWRIAIVGKNGPHQEAFWCDRLDRRTDVCLVRGDVHVVTGNSSEVILHSRICEQFSSCGRVETIRPYTRKWEEHTMASVQPVTLKCVVDDSKERLLAPLNDKAADHTNDWCDDTHSVPAVLFSSAGFTGNPYHDFQDVLIPLFIVSQHLKGHVVFVVNDIRPWWVERWSKVLHQLSRYPIIDLNEESGQHCFPEVMAGLYVHREFGVSPSLMPNGETMEDFQRLLYEALASPKLKKSKVPGDGFSNRLQTRVNFLPMQLQTRLPRLLIVARKDTRVLINQEEVIELARELQFDVKVVTLSDKIDLQTIYGWFYTSDVVMGVHGAELAHSLFMRRKAVLLQIVPLGTDWPASHYYAIPAVRDLGLNYMEYKIKPEESSLSEKYGLWHPILRKPGQYIKKGWATQKQLYLTEQNVSPSPTALRNVLLVARSKAVFAFP
ncbi:unnamed protein product [Calypogeia fissa]